MKRVSTIATVLALLLAPAAADAKLSVRGSVEQVQVTGAKPGSKVSLLRPDGRVVETRRARRLGGLVFREVAPGPGYRARSRGVTTREVKVLTTRSAPPSTKIYDQEIPAEGYGYLTTRDGTELAINVHLPTGASGGPYPTLIEYSGYGYANPAGPDSGISQVANLLGYAVVDVNMRGTGCSGGAFDYFEPLQGLDGYDVIETVARQPWVMHGHVGMMGISYGGISQLFTAATRPPSLAAITPLSVIDSTQTTLYPGGILNTGFALSWAEDRVREARPVSKNGGQAWALKRVREGDEVCKANQVLHADAVDLLAKSRANSYYTPEVADPLAPITFVDRIEVPTYLACQWTDEQTGGHCPTLASRFTGTDQAWFTFTNGTHIDSLDPETFNRWFDFLEIYVAERPPRLPDAAAGAAPVLFDAFMGIEGVGLPPDPIQGKATLAEAKAAFEALPPVRILFDNGAGAAPGFPVPGFERSFASWPAPGTQARTWYLGEGGALAAAKPSATGQDAFTWDAKARPATDFTGNTASGEGGLWRATPTYRWEPNPDGTAVSYVSEPLAEDTTVLGAGRVDVWVKASVPVVDLQATITEVRPDGNETFVQGGWIRSEHRVMHPSFSEPLAPWPTMSREDAAPLRKGRWTKVTVPLYYQGRVYRAGSRLRLIVSAPGGDQPIWAFAETKPRRGTAEVQIARGGSAPSQLALPVVPGGAPTPLPPCPGLRGEPCRPFTGGA
ncbi:MAG TPA: CocE/NonD family hydrolase [Capillimicrobium sp.]|jgi:predicted acyl esterase